MMKILIGVVGLVAVGGAAWFFAGGKYDIQGKLPPDDARQEVVTEEKAGTFKGSMGDLLSRAGSWQCDVSVHADGVVSEGTTYVSGGMMRSDFTSTIPQVGNVSSHIIVRDDVAYTWTSMLNRGFRFPVQGGVAQAGGQGGQQAAMFNGNYDYDCDIWVADESKFELPAGVTF
jgi:hypothetical protein